MEEERFLVLDEEMVELKFEIGFKDGNAIDVRGDLGDVGHGPLPKERWTSGTHIMRPDGVVCVDGHPTAATRIFGFLLRWTSIFYQVDGLDATTLLKVPRVRPHPVCIENTMPEA
jgi:hypothetical protein